MSPGCAISVTGRRRQRSSSSHTPAAVAAPSMLSVAMRFRNADGALRTVRVSKNPFSNTASARAATTPSAVRPRTVAVAAPVASGRARVTARPSATGSTATKAMARTGGV
jgi:hypothetical protein